MTHDSSILKRELIRLIRKSTPKWPAALVLVYLLASVTPGVEKAVTTGKTLGTESRSIGFGSLITPDTAQLEIPPLNQPPTLSKVGGDSKLNQNISAQAYVVFDRHSGQIVLAKNPHQKLPPASLTKIATALAVLQNLNLNQEVIINPEVLEKSGGSLMGLRSDEKITVEDLLWGLLVISGNDAGFALAQTDPGGYFGLVEKMNQIASTLKLQNTQFRNVVGFDEPNHYSSAYDLTLLSNLALRQPLFAQMVATPEKTLIGSLPVDVTQDQPENEPSRVWHHLRNTHPLLNPTAGIVGVKTGWTPQAKGCLITYLKTNSREFLITVLAAEDREKDTQTLIDWLTQ